MIHRRGLRARAVSFRKGDFMKANCDSCPFWCADANKAQEMKRPDGTKVVLRLGECRRSCPLPTIPPTIAIEGEAQKMRGALLAAALPKRVFQIQFKTIWGFPLTLENFWCGEHPNFAESQRSKLKAVN